VTVQGGSGEQPCGTVPFVGARQASTNKALGSPPPPPPGPSPSPATSPTPIVPLPAPPAPVLPASTPRAFRPPAPPAAFFALPAQSFAPAVTPLVFSPTLARPIPPSGTAPVAVFSPAVAPQEKREEEEATESVHNMAAYNPEDPPPSLPAILGLIVIAAGAGTSIRRAGRSRRSRSAPALVRVGTGVRRRR
jgi:hypothetical protein